MSEKKRYVVVDKVAEQPQDKNNDILRRTVWLDETVAHGAPYFEAVWNMKDTPLGPPEHCHEFDEFIGFMSCDPNTEELGCDVEFHIDGDIVKISRNTVLFVPAGIKHSPFILKNVTRPVLNYSGGAPVEYLRKYEDGTYKNH